MKENLTQLYKRLGESKNLGEVVVLVIDEGDNNPYSVKGKILFFDENFIEIATYSHKILLKLDHICKFKFLNNSSGVETRTKGENNGL